MENAKNSKIYIEGLDQMAILNRRKIGADTRQDIFNDNASGISAFLRTLRHALALTMEITDVPTIDHPSTKEQPAHQELLRKDEGPYTSQCK